MSKELIDRKALLAEYDRQHKGEPGKARKLMEDAPEAVIHCQDCKYWLKGKEFSPFGWCLQRVNDLAYVSYKDRMEPEDFCSKGERKCND